MNSQFRELSSFSTVLFVGCGQTLRVDGDSGYNSANRNQERNPVQRLAFGIYRSGDCALDTVRERYTSMRGCKTG
jgi:hypothetical protein